jgi:hypothetical protein
LKATKTFVVGLFISGFSISIASILFMANVFFHETLGHGMLYYEPNRYIAFGELATCAYGLIFALFMLKTYIQASTEDGKVEAMHVHSVANGATGKNSKDEPDGYVRNDGVYQ